MSSTPRKGGGGPTEPPSRDAPDNPPIDLADRRARRQQSFAYSSETGGGGGEPPDGTDVRITVLEQQVTHINTALGEIRTDVRGVLDKLGHLPTKQDLFQNIATIVIIGLTVLAITVGGIVGGLSWIQPKAPTGAAATQSPQPIVIELPPQPLRQTPDNRKGG